MLGQVYVRDQLMTHLCRFFVKLLHGGRILSNALFIKGLYTKAKIYLIHLNGYSKNSPVVWSQEWDCYSFVRAPKHGGLGSESFSPLKCQV